MLWAAGSPDGTRAASSWFPGVVATAASAPPLLGGPPQHLIGCRLLAQRQERPTRYDGSRTLSSAPGDSPTVISSPTPSLLENYDSAMSIRLFASSFGANLDAATQGVIKVGLLVALAK